MANPIVSRTQITASNTPMTVKGVVAKTAFLLALSGASSLGLFVYATFSQMTSALLMPMAIVSMFLALGFGLASTIKPHLAKSLSVPYALAEGVMLGAFSLIVHRIYPAVPLSALCATFVTAALMLGLYATGTIKVTQKFRSVVLSACFAIMILYFVQLGFRLFGGSLPILFDGGLVAIGFSLFVTVIASLSLLIDFDNIDQGVHYGADQSFEWIHAMGVLSTLVWMYLEFLRLLGYLED